MDIFRTTTSLSTDHGRLHNMMVVRYMMVVLYPSEFRVQLRTSSGKSVIEEYVCLGQRGSLYNYENRP